MTEKMSIAALMIAIFAAAFSLSAQKITPVESDDEKPAQPQLHYYDKHGNPLDVPVLFLSELDTVKKVKSGPVYPLLNSVSVGVNFFDAVMMACGQNHQSYNLEAELSLWNWFAPVVEAGIGFADNHPKDGNFHYKGKPSFFAKVGFNYNFLYKSNPDYQVFAGFRAGYAGFRYDVTDITVESPYWGQTGGFDIFNQTGSAFYGEALAGIRVRLGGAFSMGWTFRYHFKMHVSQPSSSNVWFIPGYGTTGAINATFSLIYTMPLSRRTEPQLPVAVQGEILPTVGK